MTSINFERHLFDSIRFELVENQQTLLPSGMHDTINTINMYYHGGGDVSVYVTSCHTRGFALFTVVFNVHAFVGTWSVIPFWSDLSWVWSGCV